MNCVFIAAQFSCHKSCNKVVLKQDDELVLKQSKKRYIFASCITFIKSVIDNGNGISLSELRDLLNLSEDVIFNSSKIKLFITY